MASIKKYTNTKGSFYEASVHLGLDPITGKQIKAHKRGFKTKKDATIWAERQRVEADKKGLSVFTKEKRNIYFGAYYNQWLTSYEKQVRESTLRKTTAMFDNHILPIFGNIFLQDITTPMCQKAVNTWYDKFVDYKKIYYHFKRILLEAQKDEYISKHPCDRVKLPTDKKDLELEDETLKFWDKEQLNIFLEECKKDSRPIIYPFFRLLTYSGMRRGEILALQWSDIDFVGGFLQIKRAITTDKKGKNIVGLVKNKTSARIITLDDITMNTLKQWKAQQREQLFSKGFNANTENQFVFSNSKNSFMIVSVPAKWIRQITDRCDLPYINPHGLRHTHCTLLLEAGVNIKEVQRRLGHSDIETTLKIYSHVTEKQQKQTATDFAKYLSVM